MIRILIADDHAIVREGLKQIIREAFGMEVTGEAQNGAEALNLVRETVYDVILLDISLPGRSGLEVLKDLKAENPQLPVLILSIYPEEQYAIRAIRAGAAGYLNKASAPDELVTAIERVATGKKYISPQVAEKLAMEIDADSNKPLHEKLSDREFQILRLIAGGKTVSEIANHLALSVKTISTYRARILEKMHMKTNAELTYYAVKNDLVD